MIRHLRPAVTGGTSFRFGHLSQLSLYGGSWHSRPDGSSAGRGAEPNQHPRSTYPGWMETGHSATERDWYRVLGVDRQAGGDSIRVAYRELAWRLHPDRQETPGASGGLSDAERRVAERRMREVNEAFRVLGEPARRRAYDHARFGTDSSERSGRAASSSTASGGTRPSSGGRTGGSGRPRGAGGQVHTERQRRAAVEVTE